MSIPNRSETWRLLPEALPQGPDGVLIRFALRPVPEAIAAAGLLAVRIEAAPPAGCVEIQPGLVSVLLRFDPALTARDDLAQAALALARQIAAGRPEAPDPARRWHVPTVFAGPQLAEAAAMAGMDAAAAVRQICAADLRVLVIGFAPGQPYIGLLPEAWDLPRLSGLTPRVPAGALVVAVRQLVLFAGDSPTGWRQIGQTGFRCFQPDRDPPILLRAGDAMRFHPVDSISGTEPRLEVLR